MKNSLKKRIGNAARQARVSLGLTQEDAAEQIAVSVEFYSRIERGTSLPSLKTFIRMAVVFQVSTDKLLGLTEDETAQRILKEFAATQPKDPPELRRLVRKLRQTNIDKVRFVQVTLNELEKLFTVEGAGNSRADSDDLDSDDESSGLRDQMQRMPTSDDSDLDDPDLDGSDLDGSDLDGSDLDGSDLDGSDLDGSDLDGSDLDSSDLDGSDPGTD